MLMGSGLDTFEQTARNLNQSTWDAMLRYSPASEMSEALNRVVLGLAGLIQEGKLPTAVMTTLAEAIAKLASKQEMDPKTFLTEIVHGHQGHCLQGGRHEAASAGADAGHRPVRIAGVATTKSPRKTEQKRQPLAPLCRACSLRM